MEVGRTDGWTCVLRLLAEMERVEDVETRVSLWRAARRYAAKNRAERAAGEIGRPPLALDHPGVGLVGGERE